MKKILNRSQYLDTLRSQNYTKFTGIQKTNEALANEINWGDSLVGRLLNSILRKAQIGVNLVRIDRVIERLNLQFKSLVELIKVSDDDELKIRLFYLSVSMLLGHLIKEIEEAKDLKEITNVAKSVKNDIGSIGAPDQKTSADKKEVLAKLDEFIKGLEDMLGEEPEKSEDEPENKEGKGQLSLGPSTEMVPLSLDVAKLTPEEAKLQLPKCDYSIKLTTANIDKINAGLKNVKISVDGKLTTEHAEKLKKMWKAAALFHPDKISTTGLTKDESELIFTKAKEAYDKKDLKSLSEILEMAKKLKESRENIAKYNEMKKKIQSITAGSKTDQKSVGAGERTNQKALGAHGKSQQPKDVAQDDESVDKEKTNKEVPSEKNESRIYNYLDFITEEKDDDLLKGESKDVGGKVKVVFDKIFTVEYLEKYQVTKEDESKFQDKGERTLTIDPIIEIVKIFNRAYKIHTPGTIPSGRKNGKVSNSVFREYEYVGTSSDDARMSEEGGVNPGIGPYRNKTLFNKWENAVMDIIKDPKYQEIFNKKTVFKFGKADTRANTVKDKELYTGGGEKETSQEGGGRALLKFMSEMLDGSSLYRTGAQSAFISKYFGVTIDEKNLGFGGKKETEKINVVAEKVADTNSKLEFKKVPKGLKIEKKMIFKAKDDKKNTWFFKVFHNDKDNIFFYMANGFIYDLDLDVHRLKPGGSIYLCSSSVINFEKGSISKNRLEVPVTDTGVDDWVVNDNFNSKLTDIEVLCKSNGKIFTDDVKVKDVELNKKISHVTKDNLKKIIEKLK